tara:strand:- start:206 stop:1441 length:1236 start_codon:yes stop_codon:yes gene_type:complete
MITRAHIRRQLRKNGGIMSAVPRQGYFLGGVTDAIGSAVGKVGDVVGEIAKSPIGKAALLAGTAYATRNMGPIGEAGGWKKFLLGAPDLGGVHNTATPNILSRMIGGIGMNKATALGAGALATGAALALPSQEQRKVSFLNERGGDVEGYLRQYYKSYFQANWQEGWTQDEEDEFVAANTAEYSKGGRVGLYGGGDPEMMDETLSPLQIMQDQGIQFGPQVKKLDAGAQSVTKEGDHTLTASETNPMAELYQVYLNLLETDQIPKATTFEMFIEMVQQNQESQQARAMAAKGGRIKYGIGDLVKGRSKMVLKDFFNDEEEYAKGGRIGKYLGGMGLPGIPRMAPDGLEYDMRAGGFQPLGAQEGKDDVKANLAKNEFVMTADAVKGAGNGSVELGAQKMYDTMKRLENKVA